MGTLILTSSKLLILHLLFVCHQFVANMKLPFDKVAEIEAATRGESDSELWQLMRNGRLTSSKFNEMLKHRPTTDP